MTASASVAPNGQSRALRNWSRMRLPTITVLPPPSSSGTTKLPRLGTNTKMQPVTTPGRVERQRHVEERPHRRGAEVGRRFAQLRVEPLDRGVQRQDHQGQVGVEQARRRPRLGV